MIYYCGDNKNDKGFDRVVVQSYFFQSTNNRYTCK